MIDAIGSYGALALLGALHGLNPGMGWLLAVARVMQRGGQHSLWRSLLPMTVGHALAILVAIIAASMLGLVLPLSLVRTVVALLLIVLGVRQLRRHRHPRLGGMQMGARGLLVWSFVIATVHGAGLMTLPLAVETGAVAETAAAHAHGTHDVVSATTARQPVTSQLPTDDPPVLSVHSAALLSTFAHSAGYLVVAALLARVVLSVVGLSVIRKAWVNVDRIWAMALLLTGGGLLLMR